MVSVIIDIVFNMEIMKLFWDNSLMLLFNIINY